MSDTQETRQPRRLVRRTDDKIIAGVCSGLGDYFSIDPLLFRIGFVVLGLTGFAGILVYLGIWAFVPEIGATEGSWARRRKISTGLGVALLVGAAVLLTPIFFGVLSAGPPGTPFGFFDFRPEPIALAVVLIIVGALLLRQRQVPASPTPTPTGGGSDAAPPPSYAAPSYGSPSYAATTVPRERSALTAFTLAAALLLVGIGALLSSTGGASFDIGQLAAAGLTVVGAGLIVGAWWGRGRLLIALGVLMIPVVLVASVVDVPLRAGFGSHYLFVHDADDIRFINHAVGSIAVDFSEYRFDEGGIDRLNVELGAGQLTIVVPRDVFTEVDVTARLGQAYAFNSFDDGPGIHLQDQGGDPESAKHLSIEVEAGLASISIYRSGGPSRVHRRARDGERRPGVPARDRREGRRNR